MPQFVHVIKRTLHFGLKIWIIFSGVTKQQFTRWLRSLVKYCFYHSKIKFNILYFSYLNLGLCQQLAFDKSSLKLPRRSGAQNILTLETISGNELYTKNSQVWAVDTDQRQRKVIFRLILLDRGKVLKENETVLPFLRKLQPNKPWQKCLSALPMLTRETLVAQNCDIVVAHLLYTRASMEWTVVYIIYMGEIHHNTELKQLLLSTSASVLLSVQENNWLVITLDQKPNIPIHGRWGKNAVKTLNT